MALRQQANQNYQNWTCNLVLSSIFALLASFQLGFNMISFSMLKNLIRRFAKNEACLSYIQSSRHFRTIRLLDDFRITSDTVELYQKRMNLSMICTLKNNPAIRTMLDSYMMDFLDFMCKVHYDTEKMIKIGDIMFVIGALIGSGSSKYVIETFGRKNSILAHYLLTFVGSMLVIISVLKESVVILAVSQFFFGMQAGQAAALVPIYLNEIAPSSKRIQISSLHSLVLVAGFVTAQATLGPHIIDIDADFSYTYIILLGFPFIPAMISSIGLFYFCPDSPRALLLLHQDEHSAIISLKILRKSQFVRYEIEEIIKSANLFVKTKFRWVKLVFIELCFVFTVVAIEILFFYFSSFKKLVFFKDGIFISLFALISSVFSTGILSRFSITSLVKISLAGIGTVIMVLIFEAYFLFVKFSEDLFDYMFTDFFLVTICLIVLLVLFFSIGLLPIALLYPVDLFREDKRSNSQALCISFICAVYLCFQLSYSLLTSSPIAFLIFFTSYIIVLILTAFILALKPADTLIAEF